ncbi:hypothetical protein [Colwellia sp. MEBiC06753]
MKKLCFSLIYSIGICCSLTSNASEPHANQSHVNQHSINQTESPQANPVLLAQYLELAGVNQILTSIPEQIETMYLEAVDEQGENAGDTKILAALVQAWSQQQIQQSLINSLAELVDDTQLTALVDWQNSGVMQIIKQQEALTEQHDFSKEFYNFAQQLPNSLPSLEKRALINQLLDARQIVDAMVELTLSVSEPVMVALLDSPTAKESGFDQDSINQQLFELRALLENDLSEQISLLSYYLYRDIDDNDLIKYIDFYQSELGQLELSLQSNALHKSIGFWQENYRKTAVMNLSSLSPLTRY